MTAVLSMTSWWLGPQLAAALAGDRTRRAMCSQPSSQQSLCPGEVTIGGLRPSQSCCPSPSGEQAQWLVLLWGNTWLCQRLYNRIARPWSPAGWWWPSSSHCVPHGSSRGLGRWFEPQILKLPWADKELVVFSYDCTLLSLLASCLTFSSPDPAGSPCWRGGSCGWVKVDKSHRVWSSPRSPCQPRAAHHELCWEAGRPWGSSGVKTE